MPVTTTIASDGCATVLLDRPQKRNALDESMLESLLDAVTSLRRTDALRLVVVRGSGGSFCAGADIGDWTDPGPVRAGELSRLGTRAFTELSALPVTVLAVLEGSVLGGGLELAMACDLRISTTTARLGLPETRLGNVPTWGGVARLVDAIGLAGARALLLTGEPISGTRAEQLGLVLASAEPAELDTTLEALRSQILLGEPHAVALIKDILRGFERPRTYEPALASYASLLDASRERKQAFFASRQPRTT